MLLNTPACQTFSGQKTEHLPLRQQHHGGTAAAASGYIPPKSPATSGLYRRRKEERREGKLARQMKDRRKYYDTWMEGDEACAQLSLWEELLSPPPGFSFTNRTIYEKTNIDIPWDVMGEMLKKVVCYELYVQHHKKSFMKVRHKKRGARVPLTEQIEFLVNRRLAPTRNF